ncbi:Sec-independent protein translocase subunit TatA/TatB [Legionella impletisoli]|uniref:Preprotein translocase subunit TatB n=1 Tax=Legionella impletisoli TaxID=343510 RepID=A0A917JSL3_9GAMM|nr:twin-arginine translocase TatA/TatE family subunit [Legionella impletisoli]GGI84968.1 preprotein translocase subunit TatB [Legionella impletisoli]
MSIAELFLILVVALLAFSPSKLPMLAHHLARLYKFVSRLQHQFSQLIQSQLNEHQLHENMKKADKADSEYQKHSEKPSD